MPTARRKRRRSRMKTGFNLTKGQLNRIVDTLFHPHFSKNPDLIFVDGLAHFIVEDNPEESFRKFIKYNMPALLNRARRKRRRKQR